MMTETVQEPTGHLLGTVCRLHHSRAFGVFEAIGLYRGQPPVLKMLTERDGRTHTELAEQLHVSPPTISKMVQRMEKASFVVRKPDEHDQRVSRVYLTEAGRAVMADVRRAMDELDAETFAGLSDEEMATFRAFLTRIRDNLLHADEEAAA
jgi:MarR family transcriptional regulator, organic hydroperoxide resistance regulator